jgi:23S rRNA (adenine2503-C2)-methyltransferase
MGPYRVCELGKSNDFSGCTFCATGKMGKLRSLSSDEIIAQMFFAKKICRLKGLPAITNVVFMGMGEPADNSAAVVDATKILTTCELFQLSATRITVSTVAPTPDSFRLFSRAPCVLAWSVHAANNDLRKKLVPTTKYPMEVLRQGLIDALLERPPNFRTTMLEVALMAGVNDSEKEADELAVFARGITDAVPGCKLIVNLIPYNDIGNQMYSQPSKEAVVAFQRRLSTQGVYTHVRNTRGDDESAACGQLATKKRQQE